MVYSAGRLISLIKCRSSSLFVVFLRDSSRVTPFPNFPNIVLISDVLFTFNVLRFSCLAALVQFYGLGYYFSLQYL